MIMVRWLSRCRWFVCSSNIKGSAAHSLYIPGPPGRGGGLLHLQGPGGVRGGRGQGDEEVRQNLHRGQGSEEEEGRSGARISIGRGRSVLGTMLNVHRYIFVKKYNFRMQMVRRGSLRWGSCSGGCHSFS